MQILDVRLIKIFLDILLYVEQEQNEEKLKLEKKVTWLNSIGRRKHARKAARKALATKRASKRITTKKVHFSVDPKPSFVHLRPTKKPVVFNKWTGVPVKRRKRVVKNAPRRATARRPRKSRGVEVWETLPRRLPAIHLLRK